jgi:hypothetical protein
MGRTGAYHNVRIVLLRTYTFAIICKEIKSTCMSFKPKHVKDEKDCSRLRSWGK